MDKKQLPVKLLRREITWGIRYLLFQLVFLGPLLSVILSLIFPQNHSIDINPIYFLINFVAVVGIFHRYLGQSLKYGSSHWGKLLLSAILGFFVYAIVFQALHHLIHSIRPQFQNPNDGSIAQSIQSHFWLTAFATMFFVPLTEEVLFRGLIFGALHERNRVVAYILSVLTFALIHVLGYWSIKPPLDLLLSLLQYIPAGLVLAWSYEYSGSILAPTLIHTAVNAIAIISMR